MTNADLLQRDGVRAEMLNWQNPTSKAGQKQSYENLVHVYDTDIRANTGYVAFREVVMRLQPYLAAATAAGDGAAAPLRVLDAGCGTGLSGAFVKAHLPDLFDGVSLLGVDYCDAMLKRAAATGAYAALHTADVDTPFELPGAPVDAVIAAGLFFDNHVEPPAMRHIFAHLRVGGHAVLSVREASFRKRAGEYYAAAADSGCAIVEVQTGPYREAENMKGAYVVLRKKRDVDA